jgi:hypothetical protein
LPFLYGLVPAGQQIIKEDHRVARFDPFRQLDRRHEAVASKPVDTPEDIGNKRARACKPAEGDEPRSAQVLP